MSLVKHSQRTIRKPCRVCGRKDLYWGHDTDRTDNEPRCSECGVTGAMTLLELDGSRHTHDKYPQGKGRFDAPKPKPKPYDEVKDLPAPKLLHPTPQAEEKKEMTGQSGDVQAALELLAGALGPKVDRDEIAKLVRAEVASTIFPTRTVIEKVSGDKKEVEGDTHAKLADVTMALMAGEHVLMVGPAGTGKSTIAAQAAKALDLDEYSISLSPQTPASQLVGYMQATGDYVPTLFRKAFEDGGVFHFDEMDNAHPSVLAVINAALANGKMAFPDKMVHRHENFRAVASANTYGRGADRAYVGRQAIDAATLDRFSVVTIEVDEALENALCHASGLEVDQVTRVLKFVRRVRKNAEDLKLPIVVSPRASVGMCRLLRAGYSWEAAVDSRVRRGMSDAEWKKING
jgi:cobaltochelatase CobS